MNSLFGKVAVIIAAIALILSGLALYMNRVPGPIGPKGDTGESIVGPQGVPGINGTDGESAPININPYISLVTQSGDFIWIFPSILNGCKYTYNIMVHVEDTDDEEFRVSFYWSDHSCGPWNLNDIYFGGNGDYKSTKVFQYNNIIAKNKTLYWLIEAWDGSDISMETYSYTITP